MARRKIRYDQDGWAPQTRRKVTITWRSVVAFVGLALTINESLMHGAERPSLYVLWAAMMGFPILSAAIGQKGEDK